MKRITEITIKTKIDNDPDISYLGEITRIRDYDLRRHCWSIPTDPNDINNTKWYMPANHLPHNPKSWGHISQKVIDETIAKYGSLRKADIAYAYEDLRRLQDYYTRRWWMEGIVITAKIEVSEDGKNWAHDEVIASLWGIESDGDKKYKHDIIEDLKSDVAHDLKIWGFTDSDIAAAMSLIKEET